eukprot:160789_1
MTAIHKWNQIFTQEFISNCNQFFSDNLIENTIKYLTGTGFSFIDKNVTRTHDIYGTIPDSHLDITLPDPYATYRDENLKLFTKMAEIDIESSDHDKLFFMAIGFMNFHITVIFPKLSLFQILKYLIRNDNLFDLVTNLILNIFNHFNNNCHHLNSKPVYCLILTEYMNTLVIPLISMLHIHTNNNHKQFVEKIFNIKILGKFILKIKDIEWVKRIKNKMKRNIKCNYKYCKNDQSKCKLRLCSKCKIAYYCCKRCQKKDWSVGNHCNSC